MSFGDWPGWAALIFAIISPLITTFLTNKHQRKMFELKQKYERTKSCDKLISELASLAPQPVYSYNGFSKEALEATRYLSQQTFSVFMNLSVRLAESSDPAFSSIYKSINDVPFYIFPDENNPKKKKLSHYEEIIFLIINELKSVS